MSGRRNLSAAQESALWDVAEGNFPRARVRETIFSLRRRGVIAYRRLSPFDSRYVLTRAGRDYVRRYAPAHRNIPAELRAARADAAEGAAS